MAESARRPRVAPFIALAVAAVIAALFVVLATSTKSDGEIASTYLEGRPAPSIVGETITGEPFDLSRRKGSWVLVNFFDSDCVPCRTEHPELLRFDEEQKAAGIDGAELYAVLYGDTKEEAEEFFGANGGTWPVVIDPTGGVSVAYGVAQVPETWIIDPTGIVRRRLAGAVTADGLTRTLHELRTADLVAMQEAAG